jgi:two-component system alkaline phosphatase synthesis response regulator PhoP
MKLKLRNWEATALSKILIIEDEPEMVLGLRDAFEYEGFEVHAATSGKTGLQTAWQARPDLILLDVMLPEMNGLDVCRRLRDEGFERPIIMLTARGQEIDKVIGLEIGADDYVTKPFSIRELLARVRAQLRRAPRQPDEVDSFRFGALEVNFRKHQAFRDHQPIELSPREFEILKYFVAHRGEIITREQLLNEVWGYDNFPLTRTVDNHIARLRQKIEAAPNDPQFIITVHRLGYKFLG